ncbi:MAG: hypothetical protein JXO72_08920 [Vicinamibacteria bacterium]|nr:hypothetical protein [Vicinamibacteria bacterium]
MKRFRKHVMAAVFVLMLVGTGVAGDVTGKWTAEFDTMVGVQKYAFDFAVEGETLTGEIVADRAGEKEELNLAEGRVSGDRISFVENMTYQGQTVRVAYEGKIAGDEIRLTRDVGGFVQEELVAKRVTE